MVVDTAEYGESSPFLRKTPYVPLDSIVFKTRYQWRDKVFVPESDSVYIIDRDLPEKLARLLIAEGVAKLGRTMWENQEEFHYEVHCIDWIKKIVVPAHSLTDFYSVPRFLWWLYPPSGVGRKAAHVHDLLCQDKIVVRYEGDDGNKFECIRPVTSLDAAEIFDEAMEVSLVPKRERWLKYHAVVAFGPRFEAYKWET